MFQGLVWLWAAFAMFSVQYKCDGVFFLCEFLYGVCWRFAFVKSSFLLGCANILHLHTWLTRESSVLSTVASSALRITFWVHLLSLSWFSMTTKFVKWKLRAWVLDYENEVSEEPTVITEWENWIVFQVCVRQQLRIRVRVKEGMSMWKSFWILDFIIRFMRQFWWYITEKKKKECIWICSASS